MTAPRLAPGEYVARKYLVKEFLREDGATAAHFVVDANGREFVLKFYSPTVGQRADVLATMQAVNAQVNRLPVELAVHVADAGVDSDRGNALFVVTERARLVPLPKTTPQSCASILRAMAKTLGAAHAQGLFHGALKPGNVLVDSATPKSVRLVDFGANLARAAMPTDAGWAHAAPWMAPEQLEGAPASAASDAFSVALVLFHALTGGSFWRALGANGALDVARFRQEIATTPRTAATKRAAELSTTIPAALDAFFARALAAAPNERFAGVGELSGAFDQALAAPPPTAAPSPAAANRFKSTQYAQPSEPPPPQKSSLKSTQYVSDASAAMPSPRSNVDAPTLADAPAVAPSSKPTPPPAWTPPVAPSAPPQPMVAPQIMAPPPMLEQAPPKKSSKLPLILALVFVLMAGGAAAAYFLLRAPAPTVTAKNDKPADEASSADDDDTPKKKTKKDDVSGSADDKDDKKDDKGDDEATAAASASAAPEPSTTATANADGVEVTIQCNPACDAVTVDGSALADPTAPTHLSPGAHVVVASKAGYKSTTDTFTVKAKTPVTRVYTLVPAPAIAPKPAPSTKPTCGKFLKKCE